MNELILYILAIAAGVMLSLQSGYNAQLGVMLKNPFLASLIAYAVSTLFSFLYLLLSSTNLPIQKDIQEVPLHLWWIGGFFSVIGISLYYYIIPKLGISKMFTVGISGQMIFVMIAGYMGWFNLPLMTITLKKVIGIVLMLTGVALISL